MPFGSPISLRGPRGVAGLGIIFVQGPPSASLQGVADQLAIDTSALDAYRYDGGQWVFAANLRGAMGVNGVSGSFYTGSGAPTDKTYTGPEGGQAFYLQASGEVWTYADGQWTDSGQSLVGPKGDAGATVRGSQIYEGHGAPPSDVSSFVPAPEPRDLYLDQDTGDLYTFS